MALITLPLANFRIGDNCKMLPYKAKEAINAFQLVYLSAVGEVKLAVNTSLALAACFGIAATSAVLDKNVIIIPFGETATIIASTGTPWLAGESYILSSTLGGMWLAEDIISTQFNTRIGVGKGTTELLFNGSATGIAA